MIFLKEIALTHSCQAEPVTGLRDYSEKARIGVNARKILSKKMRLSKKFAEH